MNQGSKNTESVAPEEVYRSLVENALQGLLIIQNGRAVFANPAVERMTGYTQDAILARGGMRIHDVIHPDDRGTVERALLSPASTASEPATRFRFVRQDGSTRWGKAVSTPVRFREADAFQIAFLDVTETIVAERHAERIHRTLTALWRCGELVPRAPDEEALLQQSCPCIAQHAGYRRVWIRTIGRDQVRQTAGDSAALDEEMAETWTQQSEDEAIRTGHHVIRRFPDGNSFLLVPMRIGGSTGGILGILSSYEDAFEKEETALLEALATDLAYGIDALRTRKHRAQLAARLSRSKQRHRELLEHAPCLICQLSPEGETRYVNPYVEEITGYSAEELIGSNWWDTFYPGASRSQVSALFQDFKAGNVLQYEMELTTKQGESRTLSWNSFNTWDESSGELIEIQGAGVDITERIRNEKILRKRESMYRLIVENQSDLVVRIDREWKMDFVSPSVGQLLGKPEARLLDQSAALLLGDEAETLEGYSRLLQRAPHTCRHEHRMRTSRGWRWIAWSCKAILDDRGAFAGAVAVGRDDTERRSAEEALAESEDRYRTLFHSAGDAIFIRDLEGPLLEVNRVACERLGYDRSELLGLTLKETTDPEYADLIGERMPELLRKGQIFVETVQTAKNGRTIPTEMNARMITYRGRQAIMSIARDITDRKRAEEKLEEALSSTIEAFGLATESRDPYTSGHQRRVTALAVAIARDMALSEESIEGLRAAGLMHDIGKLSIPSEILSKPSRLSEIEFALIKAHPQVGYDILKPVGFPWDVDTVILQHHERLNGSGYPQGLQGDEILIEARILAVADTVEAMATHRPYRPALGMEPALEEITSHADTLYDPDVVETCNRLINVGHFQFQ